MERRFGFRSARRVEHRPFSEEKEFASVPAVQTLHPKENEARAMGRGIVRAAEAIEPTPSVTDDFLTREQALDELLTIHDEEEMRRQRCLTRFRFAILTVVPLPLLIGGIISYSEAFPTHVLSKATADVLYKVAILLTIAGTLLAQWYFSGWRKNTPLPNSFYSLLSDVKEDEYTPVFSSPLQQNIITALLNYPDEPRIADALCRALVYYRKDKNLMYLRLGRLLPLLPSDGSALSETARQNLFTVSKRTVEHDVGNEKEQTLPVLQAAAKEYFARVGEPMPRPRRKWFKRELVAPRNTKENG